MRRHELSDAQWGLIADLMPRSGRRGSGRWRDHRQVVNGLMWKLGTGAPWCDLPERYGPWQTVYERCSRRRREGLFDGLLDRLRLELNAEGLIDLDLWCIDSTSVRASRSAAGERKRGSGGAGAPCPWSRAWGHRHQDPPRDRRGRAAAGLHAHPGTAARGDRL
jgi:transposase